MADMWIVVLLGTVLLMPLGNLIGLGRLLRVARIPQTFTFLCGFLGWFVGLGIINQLALPPVPKSQGCIFICDNVVAWFYLLLALVGFNYLFTGGAIIYFCSVKRKWIGAGIATAVAMNGLMWMTLVENWQSLLLVLLFLPHLSSACLKSYPK